MFGTVLHRTARTNGALSQKTAKLMVFTLFKDAYETWRSLMETNQLPDVVEGVKWTGGIVQSDATVSRAA